MQRNFHTSSQSCDNWLRRNRAPEETWSLFLDTYHTLLQSSSKVIHSCGSYFHCCPWTGHPITSFASMQVHEPTYDGGVHSCKIGMVPPFSQFPPPPRKWHQMAQGSFGCGCGAFSLSHGWFQLLWPESWHAINIAAKELVPIGKWLLGNAVGGKGLT